MYLLASLPVPFSPEDIFQPLQNRCVEDAATCRRGDSKDGCGGGSPTLPGLLARGLLRALAAQGVPRCWVRLAWVCCRRAGLDFAGWGLSHGGRDPAAPGFSLACASSSAPTGSSLRIQEGSGSRYVMPARTRRPQESGRRFFLSSSHLTFIF